MTIGRLESHIAADSAIIGWLVLASGDKQNLDEATVCKKVHADISSLSEIMDLHYSHIGQWISPPIQKAERFQDIDCVFSLSFDRGGYDAERAVSERKRGLPNTQLDDQIPVLEDNEPPSARGNDYGFIPPAGNGWVILHPPQDTFVYLMLSILLAIPKWTFCFICNISVWQF